MKKCPHVEAGAQGNTVVLSDRNDPTHTEVAEMCDQCLRDAQLMGIPIKESDEA